MGSELGIYFPPHLLLERTADEKRQCSTLLLAGHAHQPVMLVTRFEVILDQLHH